MRLAYLAGIRLLGALALSGPTPGRTHAQTAAPPALGDTTFRAFLPTFEQALTRFVNGDPAAWQRLASQRTDATIMGGWGAYERGGAAVLARYDWAARRFRAGGATVRFEYLATAVSGDLAFTVAIERSRVRLADRDTAAAMALRVTHVFRREDGAWTLVHRHADPLLDRTAPSAVLRE